MSNHERTTLGTFWADARGTLLAFDRGMDLLAGWRRIFPLDRPLIRWPNRLRENATQVLELVDADECTLIVSARCRREPRGNRWRIAVESVIEQRERESDEPERDPVTGWIDATTFRTRLASALERARFNGDPCVLLVADIDRMRRINDRFGRSVGDHTLASVARIAERTLSPSLCGRLKGDRFGLLLEGLGRGDARRAGARLRRAVERFPFTDLEGRRPFGITLSIGAANSPADADSAVELLRRASEARDEAHAQGGNRVWCYVRRPRVPLEVPVYFDGRDAVLAGFSRDLSHSGLFVQTAAPVERGMRCALRFEVPGATDRVHVLGKVVRSIAADPCGESIQVPGMAIEFEKFGGASDRRSMERYLHAHAATTWRPEREQSVG